MATKIKIRAGASVGAMVVFTNTVPHDAKRWFSGEQFRGFNPSLFPQPGGLAAT